jgi:transposase
VLVLDNASIHRSPRLRELCEAYSVALEFLPPYSPDFNPIEATFHNLKAWIQRNY